MKKVKTAKHNRTSDIDYVEEAKTMHERLSRFIQSERNEIGEDFSDVYSMIDRRVLRELIEELEFQVFRRDARQAECAVDSLMSII